MDLMSNVATHLSELVPAALVHVEDGREVVLKDSLVEEDEELYHMLAELLLVYLLLQTHALDVLGHGLEGLSLLGLGGGDLLSVRGLLQATVVLLVVVVLSRVLGDSEGGEELILLGLVRERGRVRHC
jgi:hypothetical protein